MIPRPVVVPARSSTTSSDPMRPTRQDETRVITFGTFDVFHVGHLRILERARALGDRLIVGISTDELNISKKGRAPVFTQASAVSL